MSDRTLSAPVGAPSSPAFESSHMRGLKKTLTRARWRIRFGTGLAVLSRLPILPLILSIMVLAVDNVIHLPGAVRLLALGGVFLALVAGVWTFVREVARPLSDELVALELERLHGKCQNRLINAVQLGCAPSDRPKRASVPVGLLDSLAAEASAMALRCPTGRLIPTREIVRRATGVLGLAAVVVLYASLLPDQFSNATARFLRPLADVPPLSSLTLIVSPGDCRVARGKPLLIQATTQGEAIPESASLDLNDGNGAARTLSMDFDGSRFVAHIPSVDGPLRYRVRAADARTRWYTITTVEPPQVAALKAQYTYPAYAHLKDHEEVPLDGRLAALVGSRVSLRVRSTKSLSDASVEVGGGKTYSERLTPDSWRWVADGNRGVRDSFDVTLPIERDTTYRILLTGTEGFTNDPPAAHDIRALPDEPPAIRIVAPRDDVTVQAGQSVAIFFQATDDLGLSSVEFRQVDKSGDSAVRQIDLPRSPLSYSSSWEYTTTGMEPGDSATLYFVALDTRPPVPGRGESGRIRVTIASSAIAQKEPVSKPESPTPEGRQPPAPEHSREKTADLPYKGPEEFHNAMKGKLALFKRDQQAILAELTKMKRASPDYRSPDNTQAMKDYAKKESDWVKTFKTVADWLAQHPFIDLPESGLRNEFNSIYEEVKPIPANLVAAPHDINVTKEQVQDGLELAKTLTHKMDEWLAEAPDRERWNLEQPDKPYDVPMAPLPDELEDLVGDLLEDQSQLSKDIEDKTSAWADSIDKGVGWQVADGPISNYSARGKTGNVLPNDDDIAGRSGEGRSGRSLGEMVQSSAVGKGGRDTPTRLTLEGYGKGQVKDSSQEPVGGATGGGKLAGSSALGLIGPPPPFEEQANGLAQRQADLKQRALVLRDVLLSYRAPTEPLDSSIAAMDQVSEALRSGNYAAIKPAQAIVIGDLKSASRTIHETFQTHRETPEEIRPSDAWRESITRIQPERFPPGYADLLARYYKRLAAGQPSTPQD